MKFTLGWDSNEKKVTILWEKYEYQFPRFSPWGFLTIGFFCIFSWYGKLMETHAGNWMGKSTHTMGKVLVLISQVLPMISFVAFSRAIGNRCGNPCISHMMKYTVGLELDRKKNTHNIGKV